MANSIVPAALRRGAVPAVPGARRFDRQKRAPLDVTLLLDDPKAAGVSLAIHFDTRTVTITSPHYNVATVTLRAMGPLVLDRLVRGEVTADDVLAVRWGSQLLH